MRNSVLWWIPTVLAWMGMAFGLGLAAVCPPLNLVLVPCGFFVAASVAGFFGEKVSRVARCAACRKVWVPGEAVPGEAVPGKAVSAAGPAVLPGGHAGPAHERAVERRLVGEAEEERDLAQGEHRVAEVPEREISA